MPRSSRKFFASDIEQRNEEFPKLAGIAAPNHGNKDLLTIAGDAKEQKVNWDFSVALSLLGISNTTVEYYETRQHLVDICQLYKLEAMVDSQETAGRKADTFDKIRRIARNRKAPNTVHLELDELIPKRYSKFLTQLSRQYPASIMQELVREMGHGDWQEEDICRRVAEAAGRCARKYRGMTRGRTQSHAPLRRTVQRLVGIAGEQDTNKLIDFVHEILAEAGIPHPNPDRDQSRSKFVKLLQLPKPK